MMSFASEFLGINIVIALMVMNYRGSHTPYKAGVKLSSQSHPSYSTVRKYSKPQLRTLEGETQVTPFHTYRFHSTEFCNYKP